MNSMLRTPDRPPKLWERYVWLFVTIIPPLMFAAYDPVGWRHRWIFTLPVFGLILVGTAYRIYLGIWIMRLRRGHGP
jgi:hypothetical protein